MKYQSCKHLVWAIIVAMAALFVLGLRSGLMAPASAAPTAAQVWVYIYDGWFSPSEMTIVTGTEVLWTNQGDLTHTVAITGGPTSGPIPAGGNWSYTFAAPGDYAYHDSDPDMQEGLIHVVRLEQMPVDISVSAGNVSDVISGAQVDYQVRYDNNDSDNAVYGVVLTVTLPTGVTVFTSTQAGQDFPPFSYSGQQLVYHLGQLAANGQDIVDLSVLLPGGLAQATPVTLTASLAATNPDPYLDNNYSENVALIPAANLVLSLYQGGWGAPFVSGGVVTYTLSYRNVTPDLPANSVVVTQALPISATYISASTDGDDDLVPVTPIVSGNLLTFTVGDVPGYGWGRFYVAARLDNNLLPDEMLKSSAGIQSASIEAWYDDNYVEYEQPVAADNVDLWVSLSSASGGEIGEGQYYNLDFGNAGTREAENVQLSLSLPSELADVTFNVPPTSLAGGVATWKVGQLSAWATGETLQVEARLAGAGIITATAMITSPGVTEARYYNNMVEVGDDIVEISQPSIQPHLALVGAEPVFFGLGTPQATVSLYLSGTVTVTGRLLGTAVVDDYGTWTFSTTTPIIQPDQPDDWYWITATQQLNGRVSPVVGVVDYASNLLEIDTNSLTIDGQRWGGIDAEAMWRRNHTYELGMRILTCDSPLTPTLQALYFNNDGLMTGYDDLPAAHTGPAGYVDFDFQAPGDGAFQLYLDFYCAVEGQTAHSAGQPIGPDRVSAEPTPPKRRTPVTTGGHWKRCPIPKGASSCKEWVPDPPKPPKPPEPLAPLEPLVPLKPKVIDPDGFVYDAAMVNTGATITQSIITDAWVTATQQVDVGQFDPWNALVFDQVNPQFTDSQYPDNILRPGYYSFLVPPGKYRILANAPGYLPYESDIIEVIANPVTMHIPMQRTTGRVQSVFSKYKVYLPAVIR